jgi:uncharacterized protein DUF6264
MSDAVQPDPVRPPPGEPEPVSPSPSPYRPAPMEQAQAQAAPAQAAPAQAYDRYASATPAKRPIVMWDLVTTIVLLVLMIGAALVASFLSFFLAFAGDSCGASSVCDYDRMATGMMVAMIGPLLVGLLALIAAVIVLVLKRIAFWIPIVGILLIAGIFAAGVAITISGVTPSGS